MVELDKNIEFLQKNMNRAKHTFYFLDFETVYANINL